MWHPLSRPRLCPRATARGSLRARARAADGGYGGRGGGGGGPGVMGSGPSFSAPSRCYYLSLLQTNQDSALTVRRYQHESEPHVRCSTRAPPQQTARMQSGSACCTQSLGPGSVLPTAASLHRAVLGLQVSLMSKGQPSCIKMMHLPLSVDGTIQEQGPCGQGS